MLFRLQTGPSERSPAAYSTSRKFRSSSMASQPSRCSTTASAFALDRRTDFGGRRAQGDGALRLADDPHQDGELAGDGFSGVVHGERRRQRHRIAAARHRLAQRRKIARRRRVHREQAADEGPCPAPFSGRYGRRLRRQGNRTPHHWKSICRDAAERRCGRRKWGCWSSCLPVPARDVSGNFPQNRAGCNLYSITLSLIRPTGYASPCTPL